MKTSQNAFLLTIMSGAAALLLWGCATTPSVIPDNLSITEIFQRAQDASDKSDYSLAVTYYSLTAKNYPDDAAHIAWASYEIAFLYHKMGKNDTALSLVNDLLDRYAKAGDTLPAAPRVLAEKLKTRLQALAPVKK
jgi:outer membrane protein assembly factor BamD (BamD/ComL family)